MNNVGETEWYWQRQWYLFNDPSLFAYEFEIEELINTAKGEVPSVKKMDHFAETE